MQLVRTVVFMSLWSAIALASEATQEDLKTKFETAVKHAAETILAHQGSCSIVARSQLHYSAVDTMWVAYLNEKDHQEHSDELKKESRYYSYRSDSIVNFYCFTQDLARFGPGEDNRPLNLRPIIFPLRIEGGEKTWAEEQVLEEIHDILEKRAGKRIFNNRFRVSGGNYMIYPKNFVTQN